MLFVLCCAHSLSPLSLSVLSSVVAATAAAAAAVAAAAVSIGCRFSFVLVLHRIE